MAYYVCPIENGEKRAPAFALKTFDAAVEAGRMDMNGPFMIEDVNENNIAYYATGRSVLYIIDPTYVPANYQPGCAGGHGLRPVLDPAEMPGWDDLMGRLERLDGYKDSTYKNDVSPSVTFRLGGAAYQLFMAPRHMYLRTDEQPFAYTLLSFTGEVDEEDEHGDVEIETDDPLEVLAWINEHDVAPDPLTERARRLELGPAKRRASDGVRESDPLVQRAKLLEMNPRRNPGSEDVVAAKEKFEEFHQKVPRKIFEGQRSPIPATVRELGVAKFVLYRSDKKNPETGRQEKKPVDYIHEHDAGVHCYEPGGDTEVPAFLRTCEAFVLLGKCLGFGFADDEGEHEAQGTRPLPDLYATPCGKALVVLQDRREVIALVWGGALNVEARGIVG